MERREAKALGLPFYQTGRPCVRGHEVPRVTASGMCPECDRQWREDNREKMLQKLRARYQTDPAYRKQVGAWGHRNLDKKRAITKKWRSENKEKIRKWQDDNREKLRSHVRNRRALKKSAEGSHGEVDISSIRKNQRGKCAYCRIKLGGSGHVDHIVSIKNGGGNWPKNLQLLCASCNLSKGSKDPVDFARYLGKLI